MLPIQTSVCADPYKDKYLPRRPFAASHALMQEDLDEAEEGRHALPVSSSKKVWFWHSSFTFYSYL